MGIECTDRLGRFVVRPRLVVDCSGDGDTSARAGVPYTVGDGTGNLMAVTLSFHLVGVDCDVAFAVVIRTSWLKPPEESPPVGCTPIWPSSI